jgi:DNA repair protein RadC
MTTILADLPPQERPRERLLRLGPQALSDRELLALLLRHRSIVPVREILNAVLRHDGRAFAIVHNHPSGNPEPSEADHRATAKVRDAASVVGLRFLGHVIVGDGHWAPIAG